MRRFVQASRAIETKSIYVVGIGSVSPIGPSSREASRAIASGVSGIRPFRVGQHDYLLGRATEEAEAELELLRRSTSPNKALSGVSCR